MGTTSDKLMQIANNSTKLYDAGKNSVFKQFPESLQGSAEGTICALTDISSIEHTMEVQLSSKNILPYPYVNTSKVLNGITFTDNGDGSIHAKGTATGEAWFMLSTALDLGSENINAISRDSANNGIYTASKGLFYGASNKQLSINFTKGTVVDETYYPQVEEGTVATNYTPYITDFSGVKLFKSRINIWDEQWELGSIGGTGANQTATDTIRSKNYIPVKGGVKYGIFAPQMSKVVCYDTNKKYYTLSYPSGNGSFTPSQDGYVRFAIGGSVGTSPAITEYENNICISVYSGHTIGIYEPYTLIEYQAEEDGTVKGVTSIYPITTLTADAGMIINCNYIKDVSAPVGQIIDKSITEITIPNNVTTIGGYAFILCQNLNKVTFHDNITSMGDYAFANTRISDTVSLPKNLATIGVFAFRSCIYIEKFIFGDAVKTIGNSAFQGNTRCLEYDFSKCKSIPTLGTNVFNGISTDAKILVPYELYDSWKAAANWETYADYMVAIETVKTNRYYSVDKIWTPGVGSWGYIPNTSSATAYYKINDGEKVSLWGYSNVEISATNYEDGYEMTIYGTINFTEPGRYSFWWEDDSGKQYYRKMLDVVAVPPKDFGEPFTFTSEYDSVSYTALEGMTWEDWIYSEYNTNGYEISGDYVTTPYGYGWLHEGYDVATDNYIWVKPSDIIRATSYGYN